MSNELKTIDASKPFLYIPKTFDEMYKYAQFMTKTGIVPKAYLGKPDDAFMAIQHGAELGVSPQQSLVIIAIINGRPCIWGDGLLAIIQTSPHYEYHKEYYEGSIEKGDLKAICEIKRRGSPVHTQYFDIGKAMRAKLWQKQGPWTDYPERMLMMRARGFAVRDKFAAELKGMITAEEAMDYPVEKDITPREVIKPKGLDAVKSMLGIESPKPTVPISPKINEPNEPIEAEQELLEPVEAAEQVEAMRLDEVLSMIRNAKTIDELNDSVSFTNHLTTDEKTLARDLFKDRKKFLSAQST
jgi:hypothetical protein